MTTKKKSYSKPSKIDAVKLVTGQGYNIAEASRNLDTHPNVLRNWREQIQPGSIGAFPGKGHMSPEKEELHRLRKENMRLRMEHEIFLSKVRQIHSETRGAYGSRRTSEKLRSQGHDVGRYRAHSLMKKAGVFVKRRKKFTITTESKHNFPVAPNLLNRNYQVDRPDAVWCSDISYLWTIEGWLYLAVIIDLYSRKIVGWAMSSRMKASLATEALSMAYNRERD